jgi:pSer/pThr/pTyr-binding forkhead associated (FHA) protein
MTAVVANLLKLAFVGMLYLFLWQVARSIGGYLGAGRQTIGSRPQAGELIVVRSDSQAGTRVVVTDSVIIGRSDEADFFLDDPYASTFHMRLTMEEGTMTLADLGTTNGTYVNGRRVTTPMPLNTGDSVQVGKTIMEVR